MARQYALPIFKFVPNPTLTSVAPKLAPVGTIQELATAAHANGDTLTFDDGTNPATVFEYRVTAGSVGAGHVKIDVSGVSTAAAVAAITIAALLSNGLRLSSATADGSALITVVSATADEALPYTLGTSNVLETVSGMTAPTGTKTWTYKLAGEAADGTLTAASAGVSTVAGGSALDALHLNRLTWTDPANAVRIHVYRTVDGAASTPTTLGQIGTVLAGVGTFDDAGLAGDASTAPSTNSTGVGKAQDCAALRDLTVQLGGTFVATVQFEASIDGVDYVSVQAAQTTKALLAIADATGAQLSVGYVRARMTAYTSGTPDATLLGHDRA